MKTRYTVVLSMIAGAALGAAAIQGLHAQAKPKAYVISETEVIDAAAQAVYIPLVRAAQNAAGGRSFHTAGGKVVALEGGASQACSHHRVGQPGERRRHFTNPRPGLPLRRIETRLPRQSGATPSKQ